MLNTSCDTADSSGEPNLRHGSWAKMLPSRKAQNSGLFWVGSSQGVSAPEAWKEEFCRSADRQGAREGEGGERRGEEEIATHCQRGEQRGRSRHSRRRSARLHKAALLPIQVQLRDDVKQMWEVPQPFLSSSEWATLYFRGERRIRAVRRTVRRTATPVFEFSLLTLVLEHGREAKVRHFQVACECVSMCSVSADAVLGRKGGNVVTDRSRPLGSSLA